MELLTQVLKDEKVSTRFGWTFLSTDVGLKTAATFSANWKSNRSLGLRAPQPKLQPDLMVFETAYQILVQFSLY